MSDSLAKLLTDPVVLLALVPFIKLAVELLFGAVFGAQVSESLKLAQNNSDKHVKAALAKEGIIEQLATYVGYGSGLQKFFENMTFALMSSVVGLARAGGRVQVAWVAVLVLITLSLIVMGIWLFKERFDPARRDSMRRVNWFVLLLNAIILVLEASTK